MGEMAEPIFESVTTMGQADFVRWVHERDMSGDVHRYELLNGRVVMNPPAAWPHGEVESRLLRRLGNVVEPGRLGRLLGSSQGYELPSGDTVEPDASFVSNARWAATPPVAGKFLQVVPDLVVEILSPSTTTRDRGEKKAIYAGAGVREYWIVDPRGRTVTIFVGEASDRFSAGLVLGEDDTIESDVLPGLGFVVRELF